MIDQRKWTEKTLQAIKRICDKKQGVCVGFSLVFLDPTETKEKQFQNTIELCYDPHDPPTDYEKKRMQMAFEFTAETIKRIYGGEFDHIEDFTAVGSFH